MANLEKLKDVIKNAQVQNYQEHLVDEYFDQIVDCIEQENTKEAAVLIEKVFDKGIPDIRLIVYYLYAHFAENGIRSFVHTFPLLIHLVNDHWEILYPKNKIEKHFHTGLNWFFSQILLKIKFYEKMQQGGKVHPVWKANFIDVSPQEILTISDVSQEFRQFFLDKWPRSVTKDRISNLVNKVSEIKSIISKNEIKSNAPSEILEDRFSENEEVPSEMENRGPSEINAFDYSATMDEPMEGQKENDRFSVGEREELKKSIKSAQESLDILSNKMNIFEEMVVRNDYLKAAIIARDMEHIIENFDPLKYFPNLFSNYYSLFAKHAEALSEQFENQESHQVKALEKLYQANLQMFIDW